MTRARLVHSILLDPTSMPNLNSMRTERCFCFALIWIVVTQPQLKLAALVTFMDARIQDTEVGGESRMYLSLTAARSLVSIIPVPSRSAFD